MADLNDLNQPTLTSSANNEVLETLRGHIVRIWKGDYTGMGNLVTGIRRWVRVGTTDVKLVERNAGGTEDTLYDSSLRALKTGTNATGTWPISINGNAATASAAPASDVYAWAKQSSKPSYSKSEVGLSNVDNTADSSKSVSYAASAGTAATASNPAGGGSFVTSSNIADYFGKSLSTNGYQRIAGGFIIQWGTFHLSTSGGAQNFPIAFPNSCLSITGTAKVSTAVSSNNVIGLNILSASQFTAYAPAANYVFFMAIGY